MKRLFTGLGILGVCLAMIFTIQMLSPKNLGSETPKSSSGSQIMSMDEVAALSSESSTMNNRFQTTPYADIQVDVQDVCKEDPAMNACVVVHMTVFTDEPIALDPNYAKPLVGKAEWIGVIYKVSTPTSTSSNITAKWNGETLTTRASDSKPATFSISSYYSGKPDSWEYFLTRS